MKRKGAAGVSAGQRILPAANEEFADTVNDLNQHDPDRHDVDRLATARSGWDPYEVWRTRVKASSAKKKPRTRTAPLPP